MALEAGRVEARIGADIGDLERGVLAAEAALQQFARDAQRSLDAAFDGRNIAPAVERAARDAVDRARRGMESRLVGAGEAMNRGLIDADGLVNRAKQAGESAAKELDQTFGRFVTTGLIPPETGQRITADLTDAARRAGEEAGRVAAQSFGDQFERAVPQMQAISRRLMLGVTAPVIAGGVFSFRSGVEMERLEMGLQAVAGSADEAERQLARLRTLAREPGLGFREAIQGSINLQAVGLSAERSERALLGFGRAVALTGGGAQELDRIFVQLGQSAAVGRVLSADWRPIIQTAPAVAQAMQEVFGTIDPQEIEALGLGFDEFFDQLVAQLEKLPPVAGGGSKALEDFSDASFRARAAIGDQLLPAITPLVSGMANLLEEVQELDPRTVRLWIAMAGGAAAIGPTIGALGSLAQALTMARLAGVAALPVLGAGGLLAVGIGGLAAAFVRSKLEAAAAAAAYEDAAGRAANAGAEFNRASMMALNAAINQARVSQQQIAEQVALTEAAIASNLRQRHAGVGAEDTRLREELARLKQQAEITETRISALVDRRNELMKPPPGDIIRPDAPDTVAAAEARIEALKAAMRDFPPPRELVVDTSPDAVGMNLAAAALAEYEQAQGRLNERAARGLIDQQAMEAGARTAARAYQRALLKILDGWQLSPEIRAQIQARLKVEFDDVEVPEIDPPVDAREWQQMGEAAAVAAMGLVNVADAFGEMDERARRAVTGLSELARSVGSLQTSGGLFQAANIGPLIGIAGGIAQVVGSALQGNTADQEAIRSNTQALDKLRLAVEGWRATAASLDRAMQVATRLRDDERIREAFYLESQGNLPFSPAAFAEFERTLRSAGLTMRELDAIAEEYGIEIYHKSGRLSREGLDQLVEALDLAGAMLTGFADNVEGERQRLSLLDRIEGRTTLEPLDALDRELSLLADAAPDLFGRFFAGIDLASEEGRQQAREALRRMFDSFEGDDFARWMGELTRDDILEFFTNTADGLNKLEEAANSTASSLSNVPPIFDLALRRRDAMLGDFGLGSDIRFPQPPDMQPIEDTFDRLTVASGAVDSFTDSLESAWERITRFGDAFRGGATDWHVPTPVREYEERLQTLQVNIHNPPAGMDVKEVTRQVTKGIVENLQRGGANELTVALRSAS